MPKKMKGCHTQTTLATLAILVITFPTMMVRCFSSAAGGVVVVNTKASSRTIMRVREAASAFQWLETKGLHSTTSLPMTMHISSEGFKTASTLPEIPPNAHRMVFMRHGESEFNNANVFTGWCDVALTPRGVVEAIEAGQVFRSHELTFRKCYASLLTRSIVTAYRSLETAGIAYTPLEYDWRWNERHYGALQGLSKERTAVRLGQEKVMKWRRSYDACPPLMTPEHPHYDAINNDPRYRHLDHPPLGESLQDCQIRVVEAWKDICRDLATTTTTAQDEDEDEDSEQQQSEYSLLVAHANTLRALVMYLDDIGVHEIEGLNIPTAIPFYYDIDKTTGQVVSSHNVDYLNNVNKIAAGKFRGIYISDERKKRSFLERRRAANDPWMWALHDHQVKASMLEGNTGIVDEPNNGEATSKEDDLEALKEEARKNTELFAPGSGWHG